MEQTTQDYFHNFRQEMMVRAEAGQDFELAEFVGMVSEELTESGIVDGFEPCHYRAQRGMRVDGAWFDDVEGILDLFVADFDSRDELASLTKTEATSALKRVVNFFEASRRKNLHQELEETSPAFGLAREIADRGDLVRRVNFYLLSERILSERLQALEDNEVAGIAATYHIWDISRLHRQASSRDHREALDIDFQETFRTGLSCLPAHLGSDSHESFLLVVPGDILSDLYERHGARLLEQNVRSFLQARGKVNRGIRSSILNEPGLFFAYNNGITATAKEVKTTEDKRQITHIKDLQIVNGGQTTASLFHTRRKDKASLEKVFVQMKLSVVSSEESETIVPRISEYANTQNRVNAADFFSNHPFHVRMEEFSRRLWAPAQHGAQRETKWFYERARGQYVDAQSKLTPAEQRRFSAEYPKSQMFTKTDLAKFENVWDDQPRWVNHGAQMNFSKYAARIGAQWEKSPSTFDQDYYSQAIARGIIFRQTEKLVSSQPWYSGGYRANIVTYAIALLSRVISRRRGKLDFMKIWYVQSLSPSLLEALAIAAKYAHDDIIHPPDGIANVTQWCKRDRCWQRLLSGIGELEALLPEEFLIEDLVSREARGEEMRSARKVRKLDDGINNQKKVFEIPSQKWMEIAELGRRKRLFTPKESGILDVAKRIPDKIPTEKQCVVLLKILKKAQQEGLWLGED